MPSALEPIHSALAGWTGFDPLYPSSSRREAWARLLEQSDAQILGVIHAPPIGLEPTIGNAEHELGTEHPLQVDTIDHSLDRGQYLIGQFHLSDPQGTPAARRAKPAEEKSAELPKCVEPEAAGHHGISLEMAIEEPEVGPHVEFRDDMALAVRAAALGDRDDPIEHQHGRQGQLGVAGPEEVAAGTGEQVF